MEDDLMQLAADLGRRHCAPHVPQGARLIVIVYDDEGIGFVSTSPINEVLLVMQELIKRRGN